MNHTYPIHCLNSQADTVFYLDILEIILMESNIILISYLYYMIGNAV